MNLRILFPPVISLIIISLISVWALIRIVPISNEKQLTLQHMPQAVPERSKVNIDSIPETIKFQPIDYSVAFNKPLFREERHAFTNQNIIVQKMPIDEPKLKTQLPMPKNEVFPSVKLKGILKREKQPKVLILDDTTNVETWHTVGEKMNGWTIEFIENEFVLLKKEKQIKQLDLYTERAIK
ncbi:MAG: hypothetical protein ABJP33_05955 [Pseudoruegeria sp.]